MQGSPNYRIRLCDFSDSHRAEEDADAPAQHNRAHIAPEVLEATKMRPGVTTKGDMYSAGILMFWLFTMQLPHPDTVKVGEEFMGRVGNEFFPRRFIMGMFLGALTDRDPLRRPSAKEALKSRWICEYRERQTSESMFHPELWQMILS